MVQRVYFGRPLNVYDTPLDIKLTAFIQKVFSGWEIEDPNQEKHREGYQHWMEKTGRGMNYYFQEVLPQMDSGVFLSFPDGKFGAGVYSEAECLFKLDKLIWKISPLVVMSTMRNMSELEVLSVEETRRRIYVDGKRENGLRPFQECTW